MLMHTMVYILCSFRTSTRIHNDHIYLEAFMLFLMLPSLPTDAALYE